VTSNSGRKLGVRLNCLEPVTRRPFTTGRTSRRGRRVVACVKDDPFGVEFAEIDIHEEHWTATGSLSARPHPVRLDYELETGTGFVTRAD
jgi:hypothetical protein